MIGHFYDPTLAQRVIDLHTAYVRRQLAKADELDDKSGEREAAAERLAEIQEQIQALTDEAEELADSTKIDLSALELEDPPDFPEAVLDEANMPEPVVDLEWDFVDQVEALHEAKHFRR